MSLLTSSDFIYGVATSSFQIEGAADRREASIWDTFCATPGKIRDGSHGKLACNHYGLWEQDVELIKSLGVDAYRFSVCWPRVINQSGDVNEEGMAFYVKLLDKLNAEGIKPFVTLYHWDLPQYLEDKGGWLNRQTAYEFQRYVAKVVDAFGNRVHSYATLNEPFCSAYLGYEIGVHAPGMVGQEYGRKAAHHLLLAHGLGMQVLAEKSPNTLNGIVLNFTPCYPESDSEADLAAAAKADDYMNQWYAKPVLEGSYPGLIDALPECQKPEILDGDLDIICQPMDFLGINFYTRLFYRSDGAGGYEELPPSGCATTEMGWEIYPQAFTELLTSLNSKYQLPPVYITENGAAMDDKYIAGSVEDADRVEYYQSHLQAVHEAVEQGVDVRGYFAWSLMDNFEWAEGYAKRFGIVYVDYDTLERTPKASALAYKDFIQERFVQK